MPFRESSDGGGGFRDRGLEYWNWGFGLCPGKGETVKVVKQGRGKVSSLCCCCGRGQGGRG